MKYLIIIFLFFIYACSSLKPEGNTVAVHYNVNENTPIVQYSVFHKYDSLSVLYFYVDASRLQYVKPIYKKNFLAKFSVKIQLFRTNDSKEILDSLTLLKSDTLHYQLGGFIFDSLFFKAVYSGSYVLKVKFTDVNRKTDVETTIRINKKNYSNKQNFLVKNAEGLPLGKTIFSNNDSVQIIVRNPSSKYLFVQYIKNKYPCAVPPFVDFLSEPTVFIADSIFKVKVKNGRTDFFSLKKEGIYHYSVDTLKADGPTLYRFYDDFPKVVSTDLMFNALRYITSNKEYENIHFLRDKKNGVDEFWIGIAGNADRALTLIKKYYTRVEEANIFFTSYQEGWKTDRGMIYIIYGPPNVISRSDPIEAWTYGEPGHQLSVTFKFSKFKNLFTDEDYRLNRSSFYKTSWYNALEPWRR